MSDQVVYGLHAVKQMLQRAANDCIGLHCLNGRNPRLQQIQDLARQHKVKVTYQSREQLAVLAGSDKHQGCVLITRPGLVQTSLKQCLQTVAPNDLYLVLDGVQDPHNLGACLRTADAAGVKAVIVPKDRAVGLTPVVHKVAAGAAESVPLITVTNLSRGLAEMKAAGIWLVGTTDAAEESLYQQALAGPIGLVMGAEGEGIRRLTAEACDYLVSIPMQGQVASLNVSVATGICLYEINRQRLRWT